MIASPPSLGGPPSPVATTRSRYAPGRTSGGAVSVTTRLLLSSSRWNERVSAATAVHPGGGVIATRAVAAPRARLVAVTVKRRTTGSRLPAPALVALVPPP